MKSLSTMLLWLGWGLCLTTLLIIFLLAFVNPTEKFASTSVKTVRINDLLRDANETINKLESNHKDKDAYTNLERLRNQIIENKALIHLQPPELLEKFLDKINHLLL